MQKASSYYCPKKGPDGQLELPHAYQIVDRVGEGSYGEIFKVLDIRNSKLMIVKKQKKTGSHCSSLHNEHEVLQLLMTCDLFPRVTGMRQSGTSEYFMMECFGRNLEQVVAEHGPLAIDTVKFVGWEILRRLEVQHGLGYLHRDIKTQNIVIGDNNRGHQVYLIDFGLALQFMVGGKQILPRKYSGLIGTARFASLNSHQGFEQSPKDDLQSLGYVLSYCLRGRLDWQSLDEPTRQGKFEKIKQLKKACDLNVLCSDYLCIRQYFLYVRQLKYDSCVNYKYLQDLLRVPDREHQCFEWCPQNCELGLNDTSQHVQPKLIKVFPH